ncbi:unnamed protein product [Caenorhabditis bovis]|uniref:Cation efflux protein cytoplasmic domain-containing protein n=1 Tax=Caenorhabditis bovis TaxID=2654633 RepID=A0A8S1EPZ2_9PELO|nr:unnamed protein product [Caenorhabditis bovis]
MLLLAFFPILCLVASISSRNVYPTEDDCRTIAASSTAKLTTRKIDQQRQAQALMSLDDDTSTPWYDGVDYAKRREMVRSAANQLLPSHLCNETEFTPVLEKLNVLIPCENSKPSRRISKYYKDQNELLHYFEKDSKLIEAANHAKSRKRRKSESWSREAYHDEKKTKISSSAREALNDIEKSQNADDSSLDSRQSLLEKHENDKKTEEKANKAAGRLANITLFVNFSLMIAKITASWLSGSMSIISSMVDSIVDITSGLVLSISTRMIRKRDPYLYPRGRTRLEPLALILISVIMGMASVQLIIQSIKRIQTAYDYYTHGIGEEPTIDVSYTTIGIMLTTIFIKILLFIVCQKYKENSSINVLAMDHRNDCISNSVALLCAWIANRYWFYMDSIGAIIVSIYILYTWIKTGMRHIVMLSGKSADPDFINRIIKVCMDHDERITHIDTVYVYHYGTKFLVEVHIVLDEKMPLKQSHDIAESLQTNIESFPEVERAFVHTDYDYDHHPQDEHKAA